MEPVFNIGQYVRCKVEDRGTGKIELIRHETTLDRKGGVHESILYGVTWLDKEFAPTGQPMRTLELAEDLASSARGVPKFTTVEEAEAWLEQQNSPGNWTAKIEDSQATTSDMINTMIDEALTVLTHHACGEPPCDCLDCFRVADGQGEHIVGMGCGCTEQGCPCAD